MIRCPSNVRLGMGLGKNRGSGRKQVVRRVRHEILLGRVQ